MILEAVLLIALAADPRILPLYHAEVGKPLTVDVGFGHYYWEGAELEFEVVSGPVKFQSGSKKFPFKVIGENKGEFIIIPEVADPCWAAIEMRRKDDDYVRRIVVEWVSYKIGDLVLMPVHGYESGIFLLHRMVVGGSGWDCLGEVRWSGDWEDKWFATTDMFKEKPRHKYGFSTPEEAARWLVKEKK